MKQTNMGDIKEITAGELADKIGITRKAMEKRVQRKFPNLSVGLSAPLSAEQVSVLSGKVSAYTRQTKTKRPITKRSPKPAGEKKAPAGKTSSNSEPVWMFRISLGITILSIALTATGLYIFLQWAGAIAGGMFALFLFMTVLVARNNNKGDTSTQALKTVRLSEIGAACLHPFTFWRLLPEFPEGIEFVCVRVLMCLTVSTFIAYWSYSAVVAIRDYNAEI